MPNRPPVNATFLAMAIAAGMTSAITNPIESDIRQAIMAADVMMGHDENCMAWIKTNRVQNDTLAKQTRRRRRRSR